MTNLRTLWKIFAVLLGLFGLLLCIQGIGNYIYSEYKEFGMYRPVTGGLLILYAIGTWIMNRRSWMVSVAALTMAIILQLYLAVFLIREKFEIILFFILVGYFINLLNPHSKKLFIEHPDTPAGQDD